MVYKGGKNVLHYFHLPPVFGCSFHNQLHHPSVESFLLIPAAWFHSFSLSYEPPVQSVSVPVDTQRRINHTAELHLSCKEKYMYICTVFLCCLLLQTGRLSSFCHWCQRKLAWRAASSFFTHIAYTYRHTNTFVFLLWTTFVKILVV